MSGIVGLHSGKNGVIGNPPMDMKSLFTQQSGWANYSFRAYAFNGIMYISSHGAHDDEVPASGSAIYVQPNSAFWPVMDTTFPTISSASDAGSRILCQASSGSILIYLPTSADENYYITFNGSYAFAGNIT